MTRDSAQGFVTRCSVRIPTIGKLFYLSIILLCVGCRATPVFSVPTTNTPATCITPAGDKKLLVGLAVSGGGSRAALFAAGAFEALGRIAIGPQKQSLLEQVSYISSVSGGSMASSYFALKKPSRDVSVLNQTGEISADYQRFFKSFKESMGKDYEGLLLWRQLAYFRWFNPSWTAQSLAEGLSENYLGEAKFTDLAQRETRGDSPRLLINTTLYNDGRRFLLSTLPRENSQFDLIGDLEHFPKIMSLEKQALDLMRVKWDSLISMVPEDLGINACPVRIAGAVAASMSFPPIIGPITLGDAKRERYWHIGDGGLSDNTGGESLLMVFLKQLQEDPNRRAIMILIDSSFPFSVGGEVLDHRKEGFSLLNYDYSRIPSIMEERSLAYRGLFLSIGQSIGLLPGPERIRVIRLRHTDAVWNDNLNDLPDSCKKQRIDWKSPKDVGKHLSGIVTRLWLESTCDQDLILAAAAKVVAASESNIRTFLER
jgi:predicted acylesterase/phospholipase RssA